jgi:hypothetical protein
MITTVKEKEINLTIHIMKMTQSTIMHMVFLGLTIPSFQQ